MFCASECEYHKGFAKFLQHNEYDKYRLSFKS